MDHSIILGASLAVLMALAPSRKWGLGMFRVGATVALLSLLAAAAVSAAGRSIEMTPIEKAGLVWLLAMGMALALLFWRFYRDPNRTPPNRSNIAVSPADGTVIYVRRSESGVLPSSTKNGRQYKLSELMKTELCEGEAVVVGIGMTFLDVHVNRAPCPGRVVLRKHYSGLFGSLSRPEMVFENERATTVIDYQGYPVAVVQIASRLVRQIASYVSEGQELLMGQRLGIIRFGSQVDLVLPQRKGLDIKVKVGDYVRAGESIIAELGD